MTLELGHPAGTSRRDLARSARLARNGGRRWITPTAFAAIIVLSGLGVGLVSALVYTIASRRLRA